jgi:PAS domain S-box-containing protein
VSWINVVWLFVASACLTLSSILLIAGRPKRSDVWFALSALSVMALAVLELALMRADTARGYAAAVRWIHIPIFGLVASFVLFIRSFFRAGRPWLAAAVIVVRGLASLVVNFVHDPSLNYDAITGLRQVPFLGERISVAEGIVSPWTRLGELSSLLLLAFLADATIAVWRRGDRRRAAFVGGSALIFVTTSVVNSALIHSSKTIAAPYLISVPFFAVLAAMSYEVALDFRRADELSRRLDDTESALAESERRLGQAADAADVGIWTWDVAKDEVWITSRGSALHGFLPGARLDLREFLSTLHPEDLERVRESIERLIASGSEVEGEFRVVRDGQTRWIGLRGIVERGEFGRALRVRGVSLDVTRRKTAEAEVLRRQSELAHLSRVTMLGELSGSLAHELNQPLTAILSNAQAAQRLLGRGGIGPEELQEILRDVVQEGRRAGEVIRRLRLLLKEGQVNFEALEVAEVVEEVIRLVRSDLLNRGVTATIRITEGIPPVRGDRVQIEQVLLNLVANACDAVGGASNGDKRIVLQAERDEDAHVRISVVDRGHGLPDADVERVFEPFVTTKPQGMGLGLSVCRTIIAAHGGRLWAANNSDRGATFHFTLPAARGGAS